MAEEILLTKEKKEEIQKELDKLIQVDRKQIINAIQMAREQGDLSENADYDAARNKQAEIEAKIKEYENILNFAKIIDEKSAKNTDVVKIGMTVDLLDLDDNEVHSYCIVGEIEANPDLNKISNISPLAQAILGHAKNEIVEVKGIAKPYKVKIIRISKL